MHPILLLLPTFGFLHLIPGIGASTFPCAQCNKDACSYVTCAAPELLTKDDCNCCDLCLSIEGEKCGGRDETKARCAPGMVCVSRSSLERGSSSYSEGTGFCLCEEDGAVCGSDGQTHSSVCALQLQSWKAQSEGKGTIHKIHDGECKFGKCFTFTIG